MDRVSCQGIGSPFFTVRICIQQSTRVPCGRGTDMDGVIEIDCPGCGHHLRIPAQYAGSRGACKYCRTAFEVPSPPAPKRKGPRPLLAYHPDVEQRPAIAKRVSKEAKQLIRKQGRQNEDPVIELHFALSQLIPVYYRQRDNGPEALAAAIQACLQQIAIAPEAARRLRAEWGDLPRHTGFEQIAVIRQKQRQYDAAIAICRQAQAQGWNGDWESRIARYMREAVK